MNTQGFDVVAELSVALLNQVAQAAWTSGGAGGAGSVPHAFDIPPDTMIGPYTIADGQVQIPLSGLVLAMAPDINGVDLKVELDIQLAVQNPPIPAASMFSLTADAHARLPLGNLPGLVDVGLIVDGLPQANVTAALTSGDPFAPNVATYLSQYVDAMYANGTIPNTFTAPGQNLAGWTVDLFGDIYDDPMDPAKKINATLSADHSHATISLPVHVKVTNIVLDPNKPVLPDPFGVVTRVDITGTFAETGTSFTLNLTGANVSVAPLVPAPGIEGTHYSAVLAGGSGALAAVLIPNELSIGIQQKATSMATSFGSKTVNHPSVADIESAIASQFWAQLTSRGNISVWTPSAGGPVAITDATPKALADALAIGIDAGAGANANALTNFLPGGTNFAVGIAAAKVLGFIDQSIHRPESQGGFGPTFPNPPHRVHNVDGHDADLKRLDISLTSAIHLDGDVTVINAIAGSIDVDASFTDDVGLHWADNADGTQHLVPDPGPPSVSESGLAWLLTFLFGFITFGIVGGIIAIVILAVILAVANSIGGRAVVDGVTGQLTGIGAWPGTLTGVGTVAAHFDRVDISPDGLLFSG